MFYFIGCKNLFKVLHNNIIERRLSYFLFFKPEVFTSFNLVIIADRKNFSSTNIDPIQLDNKQPSKKY